MLTSNLILDQLWKLDGNVLMNKSNIWKSKDRWNLKSEGSMVLIENVSENKVITRKENVVSEEVLILNDVGQMWENGDSDKEGFFTLTDPDSEKILTATPSNCLVMSGKQTLSDITFHFFLLAK